MTIQLALNPIIKVKNTTPKEILACLKKHTIYRLTVNMVELFEHYISRQDDRTVKFNDFQQLLDSLVQFMK